MKYLILGAGPAGRAAVEMLMELDPGSDISIAFAEEMPYYRMYLPDYISGNMKYDRLKCKFPPASWKKKVSLFENHIAVRLDMSVREVLFENGRTIGYDKLLMATGRCSDLSDLDIEPGVEFFLIDTLKNVLDISQKAVPLDKAVVLGAGLTGIQTAVSLAKAGLHVTLLEKEPLLLSMHLNGEQSDILARVMDKSGIKTVRSFLCKKIGKGHVVSDDCSEIPFNELFITCGTSPSTGYTGKHDILPDTGINPSRSFETNMKDIYAAGSIISACCSDEAAKQGSAAAAEMCGRQGEYRKDDIFVDLREFDLSFYGCFNPEEEHNQVVIRQKEEYKKLVMSDGKLSGFIYIGDSSKARLAFGMASERKQIGDAELRELLG